MVTFEDIVNRRMLDYRVAETDAGSRTILVPNPAISQESHLARQGLETRGDLHASGGVMVAGSVMPAFLLAEVAQAASLSSQAAAGSALLTYAAVVLPVGLGYAALAYFWSGRRVRRLVGDSPAEVPVPAVVALAYQDFQDAATRLREGDAPASVITEVDGQRPYLDALVTEAVRLLDAGANGSPAGVRVRNRMVGVAAQAQALAEMNDRRRQLVGAADAKALLAQPPVRFDDAAQTLAEETAMLERVLEACGADRVLPATTTTP